MDSDPSSHPGPSPRGPSPHGPSPYVGTRIRKRRVSKQRRTETLLDKFRSPFGGALVAALMVGLALGYGSYGALVAKKVAAGYAGLDIGASRDEVRYQLGAPPKGQEQAKVWEFPAPGTDVTAGFGEDGRLAMITCATPKGATQSLCPPVYGVAPGAGEVELKAAMGAPDAILTSGEIRVYAYDGLGLRFVLAQRQVARIEHGAASPTGLAFMRNVAWQLLP